MVHDLSRKLEGEIENIKLRQSGIQKEVLESLKANVDISTINLSGSGDEKESSSIGATVVGYVASFLIYIFIFVYGTQCMRGVVEEKTSRIVEVIIASVKPFELMMGKVTGIAGVGLSQFILWIVLTTTISTAVGGIFANQAMDAQKQQTEQMDAMNLPQDETAQQMEESLLGSISSAVESINMPMVIVAFCFSSSPGTCCTERCLRPSVLRWTAMQMPSSLCFRSPCR